MLVISVAGHPRQGANLSFKLDQGADGVYELWIRDHCPWAPGRISVTLTDEQRRDLIRVLGGKPVEPAMIHADAPAAVHSTTGRGGAPADWRR